MSIENYAEGGFSNILLSEEEGCNKIIKEMTNYEVYVNEVNILKDLSGIQEVPSLYCAYEAGDNLFIEMEFCPGDTLKERVKKQPLSFSEFLTISLSLANGLSSIHERGILHLDTKPSNIIVGDDGAKIIDFGISKRHNTEYSAEFVESDFVYTPKEKYYGKEGVYTDVYLLAASLHYAATGHLPFGVTSDFEDFSCVYKHSFFDRSKMKGGRLADLLRSMLDDYQSRPSLDKVIAELGRLNADDLEAFRGSKYVKGLRGSSDKNGHLSLRKCALKGIPYACHKYAQEMRKVNKEESIKFFQMAVNAHYARSFNSLALMYEQDKRSEAGGLFKESAGLGCPEGMNNFAVVLMNEEDGLKKYKAEIEDLTERAAIQGQGSACYRHGLCLLKEAGYSEAEAFLKRAAYKGKERAMAQLYVLYRNGASDAIKQNKEKSEYWLSKISEENVEKYLKKAIYLF